MNARFRGIAYSSGLLFSLAATVQGAEIALVPVSASGTHQIEGNLIHVQAGARVFLEMRVSGWDPDLNGDPTLNNAQGTIDASGFTSGAAGALALPVVACASDADCEAVFGAGARCGEAGTPNQCDFGFTDLSRLDRAFNCGGDEIYVCSTSQLACAALTFGGPPGCDDPGLPQYLATVALDVSADADGTFTVEFVDDPAFTFMTSGESTPILPLTLTPVLISVDIDTTVEACCLPTGGCEILTTAACAAAGGTLSAACLGDGNGDGVDDACPGDCENSGTCNDDPCCLPTGGCEILTTAACAAAGGALSAACLGDGNGDGVDDACPGDCKNDGTCGGTLSAEIALVPVNASGPHQIEGNLIRVGAGARVFLEIQVSNWNPDLLVAVQGTVDSSGFTSGDAGALSLAVVACSTDQDCEAAFGPGAVCGGPGGIPGQCDAIVIDPNRPDLVVSCGQSLRAYNQASLAIGAVTLTNGCPDQGVPEHLGVLVLDVSGAADGTFTLGFIDDPTKSFMTDTNGALIEPVILTPVLISIGVEACCLPTGACEVLTADGCAAVGGALGASCLGDIDGDGVDDGCQADCDGDGVPDIDEVDQAVRDCDLDGVCNGIEIAECTGDPACADCDGDRIPDGCEVDCNGNDVEDSCDIANMTSPDCNGNGVPDECENDCNNNDVPDDCDIAAMTSEDCDGNGVPDDCQVGACCLDPDGNGFYEGCADATKSACDAASGIFRGPCKSCPEQNVAIIPEPGGDVFVHVIGAPIDCIADTSLRAVGCSPTGPFSDVWKSDADGSMCHNFGASGHMIPADFFGPGSDPFDSPVCLEGVPLGLGEADTIIERSDDPFDRCSLFGAPSTVDIEITALSLKSVSPITVTFNGGQNPELWDVTVDLSSVSPPVGSLTAIKTHCNGGTYTSVLHVQPRFTFTKVSDPGQFEVLDTGIAAIPHVTLDQQDPSPWVHDLDPGLGVTGDPCTTFHPGIEDQNPTTSCDCNGNNTRDKCDIETSQSQDCNLNGTPDSCDILNSSSTDLDVNSVPDECEPDCNGNSVVDAFDISSASSPDANANTVPDECERGAAPPVADLVTKSRYLSFRPGGAVGGGAVPVVQALRVTSTDFPGWAKWVGLPDANGIARLQCTPVFRDWGFGKLHVTGRGILPNQAYVVQGIADGSNSADDVPYSDPPTAVPTTVRYGDMIPPIGGGGQPDFIDISASVSTFEGSGGAQPIPVADIAPQEPDQAVDFVDISAVVNSFSALPYPYGQPVLCP